MQFGLDSSIDVQKWALRLMRAMTSANVVAPIAPMLRAVPIVTVRDWAKVRADATNGDANACVALADRYARGAPEDGVPCDTALAIQWYVRAATAFEVESDDAGAFRAYRCAADLGFADAASIVSVCYANGVGVSQNDALGAKYSALHTELAANAAMAAFMPPPPPPLPLSSDPVAPSSVKSISFPTAAAASAAPIVESSSTPVDSASVSASVASSSAVADSLDDVTRAATEVGLFDARSPWTIEIDAATGQAYFFNERSQETAWELPEGTNVSPVLPFPWIEAKSGTRFESVACVFIVNCFLQFFLP